MSLGKARNKLTIALRTRAKALGCKQHFLAATLGILMVVLFS
jgi:hypothetical protein